MEDLKTMSQPTFETKLGVKTLPFILIKIYADWNPLHNRPAAGNRISKHFRKIIDKLFVGFR